MQTKRKRISLLSTTTVFMSAISIAIIVSVVMIVYTSYYYFVDQDLKSSLVTTAQQLSTEYFVYADKELQYIQPNNKVSITDLLKSRDISAVLFDENGNRIGTFGIFRYVYDSEPTAQQEIENSTKKVSQNDGPFFSHITITDTTYEIYTTPIKFNNKNIGYMQIAKQYALIEKMKAINIWLLVLIVPPAITIIWIFVYIIMKRFLSPFGGLVELFSALSVDTIPKKLQTNSSFTEVHSLVDACNTMIDRLKHGIEGQKHFSAYASHEINTPLTRAISDLEVLKVQNSDLNLDGTIDDLYEISSLLEGLLLLIQPEKKKFSVSVRDVLEKAISKNKLSKQKNITFSISLEKNYNVKMYPEHLYILFRNLLSNSVKYSKKNSHIKITVKKEGGKITFSIKDHGIGITEKQQENIFRPFFRTKKAQFASGIGLGLSLVKQICDYYSLEIRFKSKEKVGTTVTISGILCC